MKKKTRTFMLMLAVMTICLGISAYAAICSSTGCHRGTTYTQTFTGDAGYMTAHGTQTKAFTEITNNKAGKTIEALANTQRLSYPSGTVIEYKTNTSNISFTSSVSTANVSRSWTDASQYIKHTGYLNGYDNFTYCDYAFIH